MEPGSGSSGGSHRMDGHLVGYRDGSPGRDGPDSPGGVPTPGNCGGKNGLSSLCGPIYSSADGGILRGSVSGAMGTAQADRPASDDTDWNPAPNGGLEFHVDHRRFEYVDQQYGHDPDDAADCSRRAGPVGGEPGARPQKRGGTRPALGIAYGASVGGMGTPIGTPPNGILLGQYEEMYPDREGIGFLDWMLVALPIVAVMLAFIWWYLVRFVGKIPADAGGNADELLGDELEKLGPLSVPERRVAVVFFFTAMAWIFRKSIPLGDSGMVIPGWADITGLGNAVHDSTVALASALVLFAMPSGDSERPRLLDWDTAVKIPWGLLLLFGGGLALATGFKATGLTGLIGESMRVLDGVPTLVLILSVALLVTFLTEVTSNTATTSILVPILGASAVALGAHPLVLMIPATFSASCAFMLPVATAPNAVIFGSGKSSDWRNGARGICDQCGRRDCDCDPGVRLGTPHAWGGVGFSDWKPSGSGPFENSSEY